MKNEVIANSTSSAIKQVSEKLNLDEQIVKAAVNSFLDEIKRALYHEIPFSMQGFGKFYHTYSNRRVDAGMRNDVDASFFEGKVHKLVTFELASILRDRINGWVSDLGIKTNIDNVEVGRVVIKPEEIMKIRRVKLLEEQRRVGFRPDLLFEEDNLLDGERQMLDQLEKAPTADEIIKEMGINLGDRGDLSKQMAASKRYKEQK